MSMAFRDKLTFDHQYGFAAFNDPGSSWPGTIRCRVDRLEGWRETANKTPVRARRGVGDGDYIGKRWPAESRMLEIEGYIQTPNRDTLDGTFDSIINSALPQDTDIIITVYEPIPKSIIGRITGTIDPYQYLPDSLRWRATILCANPYKFDAVGTMEGSAGVAGISTGGVIFPVTMPMLFNIDPQGQGNQVTLFNRGTAKTFPYIELGGPLNAGWRLEKAGTGEFSSFDIALSAADSLIMDHRSKTATLNGQPVSGLITGSWWGLEPGSNTIRLYGNYDPFASFYVYAKSHWR